MKKILIAGSTGNVGSNLFNKISNHPDYIPVETRRSDLKEHHEYLDLTKKININFLKYSYLIIAAAMTKIKDCEENEEISYKINVTKTIELIRAAQDKGCFVVFLSSNNVFDCKHPNYKFDDKTCPSNIYGRHKVLVEEYIQNNYFNNSCILRLTKILKSQNNAFIENWEISAKNLGYFNVLKNYFLSPLSLDDVSDSIIECIKYKKNGLFQKGGANEISYLDYAKKYYRDRPEMLKKINIIENKPRYGSLITRLPSSI
jgi:dTDP-4-dehydrorhamnose reductase